MGNDQRNGGGSSSNNSSSSSGGGGGGGGGKKGKSKSGGGSSNNSEKPKQPQRGLGVAQLEKIRLQSQMATCGFLPPHPHPHHHHPLFPSFPPPVPSPPPHSFQVTNFLPSVSRFGSISSFSFDNLLDKNCMRQSHNS